MTGHMWFIMSILLFFIPSIEIWILIQMTYYIPLTTIFLQCLITIAAGFWLMETDNFSLWILVQSEIRNKRVPSEEVFADLFAWSGGALLIVPGILTDAFGLVLFVPVVRNESIRFIRQLLNKSLGHPPLI